MIKLNWLLICHQSCLSLNIIIILYPYRFQSSVWPSSVEYDKKKTHSYERNETSMKPVWMNISFNFMTSSIIYLILSSLTSGPDRRQPTSDRKQQFLTEKYPQMY